MANDNQNNSQQDNLSNQIEKIPEYEEKSFWAKIKKYALNAGEKVISIALTLYYCARDKDTPAWAKTSIYGSLAYFVMPIDAIPDTIPAVGYSDDLGALMLALVTVAAHIKDEHRKMANDWIDGLFKGNRQ